MIPVGNERKHVKKQLDQMLDELQNGDAYIEMSYDTKLVKRPMNTMQSSKTPK